MYWINGCVIAYIYLCPENIASHKKCCCHSCGKISSFFFYKIVKVVFYLSRSIECVRVAMKIFLDGGSLYLSVVCLFGLKCRSAKDRE